MATLKNFGLAGVSADVQFGKGGVRLIQSGGIFQAKDAAASAFARFQVANPAVNQDAVNLGFLNTELGKLQTASGFAANSAYVANTFTTYLKTVTSLKSADEALDAAIASLQAEIDTTQTGAGLGATGAYTANATGNYISGATSLKDADNKLDFNLKTISNELDATQTGAGLSASGGYAANGTANYISAATTLKDADNKLDTAIKNVSLELDTTQTAIGLVAAGTLPAWVGVNYVGSTTSVLQAIAALDTQLKSNADAITGLGSAMNYVGTVAGGATTGTAFDLSSLAQKDTGDYYKVSTGGYFKPTSAGATFYANTGDGLVKNNSGANWDIIDNTDSSVAGTTNRISVTGSTDAGFVVDIDANYAGQSTITTLGTVATGTWNASTIATNKGGTGQTTYAQGDLLVGNASSGLLKLAKGTSKQILRIKSDGTTLEYAALIAGDVGFSNAGFTATTVDAALVELETEIDATQTGAGLSATGSYSANGTANYISAATSLKDADNKLDAAIKALSTSVTNLTLDEIKSANTFSTVKATNTQLEFYGNVNSAKVMVGQIVPSATTNSYFSMDVGTAGKVKINALSGTAADVDVVIDPKGGGVVDVSSARVSNVADPTSANDAMNLTFANSNYTRRKAVDVTETNANVALGVLSGTVVRVMVSVSAAWGGASTLTVGIAADNDLLVGITDIDLTSTGVYIIDTLTDVNGAVTAYVTGSGSGAAKVVVEYLSN